MSKSDGEMMEVLQAFFQGPLTSFRMNGARVALDFPTPHVFAPRDLGRVLRKYSVGVASWTLTWKNGRGLGSGNTMKVEREREVSSRRYPDQASVGERLARESIDDAMFVD